MKHITNANGAPQAVGAYSQAVVNNGIVYTAGQIGLDPELGQLVEGGLEAQAKRVLDNLQAVLKDAGSSKEKILMTTIFLVESADFAVVNKIYADFIGDNPAPARQTVTVKELPLGARVEISVIASV